MRIGGILVLTQYSSKMAEIVPIAKGGENMNKRLVFSIDDKMHDLLREWSYNTKMSMAEIVRECIKMALEHNCGMHYDSIPRKIAESDSQ